MRNATNTQLDPQFLDRWSPRALNEYHAICAVAIGKKGPKEQLDEPLQEREAPSDRKPLSDTTRQLCQK